MPWWAGPKTLGPFQVLEFMGIELDSMHMEARLPEDKLQRTQDLLALRNATQFA